ncbi:MAG: response regulator [Nitrospinae bacterium]|nr:response regulator [Nitrospinota bacterium]
MSGKKKSILLVDDDEAHLLWSSEVLKESGYEIETTFSAEAALKMLQNKPYDLIISDLVMPEMSGTDFVRKVAGIRKGQKAIIMTGHGDVESFMESVYDLGALEYIIKPVEMEEFLTIVKKIISQNVELSQ